MAGNLLVQMRDGRELTKRQQIQLICTLSMPAILAQISSIVMQYIDASMVGSLGAQASASIGLVSTSIWLFGGICGAVSSGFSIQAAHCIGAGDTERARSVMRQSFSAACLVSACWLFVESLLQISFPRGWGRRRSCTEVLPNILPYLSVPFLSSRSTVWQEGCCRAVGICGLRGC